MPYNFATESFHTRNFVADFLREKPNFLHEKRSNCVFEPPFGGLRATYAVRLRLTGKLIVIIELFLLGAFVLSQSTCLMDRWTASS